MVTRHTRAIEQYYRPITLNERYKTTLLRSIENNDKWRSCCAPYSVNSTKLWEVRKMIVICHFQYQKAALESRILTHETRIRKSPLCEYRYTFNPEKYCRLRHVILFQNGETIRSVLVRCESSSRGTTRRSNLTQLSPRAHKTTLKRLLCWKRNALNKY